MQWYDIVMICVLIGTTVFGAMKGMAWQIASLASLVMSYFIALQFSTPLADSGLFGEQAPWNRFVAMLVIYLGTSLAVWLLFRVVAGAIDRVRLQEFDRQIGALFGAAKGILLCVAITFFAVTVTPAMRENVLNSRSGHYIALLISKTDGVMPAEIHEIIDPYLDRLEHELNEPRTMQADATQQPAFGQPTSGSMATGPTTTGPTRMETRPHAAGPNSPRDASPYSPRESSSFTPREAGPFTPRAAEPVGPRLGDPNSNTSPVPARVPMPANGWQR